MQYRDFRCNNQIDQKYGGTRLAVFALVGLFFFAIPGIIAADQWVSAETEHFRIIYRADDPFASSAATRIAELAPTVWTETTEFMRYEPRKRISVVLRSDTAYANGYFTPLPPHIELFVSSPSRYQLGSRTPDWLELVFTHEMIHYLHLTRPKGFFGVASRVFGPLTAAGSYIFMPGWALEGPTVYGETLLTPGGRGEDPFFEMSWLAQLYDDTFYSYDNAGYQGPLPPYGRIYSAGYLFTEYIHRTYGADGYHQLNDTFMRWPFFGMRRALRRTTDLRAPVVFDLIVSEIELRSAQRFALPAGSDLTPTDFTTDWHLIDTTDAGLVAWSFGPRRPGGVYLFPYTSPSETSVPTPGADHTPGFSEPQFLFRVDPTDPSSITVDRTLTTGVAAVTHPDLSGNGPRFSYSDLHLISIQEDRPVQSRRLTFGKQLLHPAITPDGATLVAVERRGQFSRLVTVSAVDGTVSPLYAPDGVRLHTPRLSPDGALIAVVENRAGAQDIAIVSVSTGTLVARVGTPAAQEYEPRFVEASEGYRLTYGSDAPGRLVLKEVVIAKLEDDVLRYNGRTIAEDPIGAYGGVFHNDRIVYQTYRSTGYAIRSRTIESIGDGQTIAPPRQIVPAPPTAPRRSQIKDTRYTDIPRPVFWFPTVAVRGGTDGTTTTDVGVYILGASVLEKHIVDVEIAYNTQYEVPLGTVLYTYQPGATTWTLGVVRDFNPPEDDGDDVTTTNNASFGAQRPLWFRTRIDGSYGIVGAATIEYADQGERSVAGQAAVRLFSNKYGPSGLFFGNTGSDLFTGVYVEPPVLDRTNTEVAARTTLSHLRWIGNSRWYLEPEISLTNSRTADAIDGLPLTTARFDPSGRSGFVSAPNALLGRFAVHLDLGPYDVARRGIGHTASLLSVFCEQVAVPGEASILATPETTTRDRFIQFDNNTIVGTSIGVDLFFNTIPIRLTGGVAVRLPHPGETGSTDARFFLNAGGVTVDRVSQRDRPLID